MKPLKNSKRFFTFYLLFTLLIAGCATTEKGNYMYCGRSMSDYVPPDTKIEILSFLSVDTVKVDKLPEIVGGIDSLLSKIKYPEIARRAGVGGIVIIEFIIDSLGTVNFRDLIVIKGIGAGCDGFAIGALLKQKYTPAMKNGVAQNLKMRSAIKFTLIYKIQSDSVNSTGN